MSEPTTTGNGDAGQTLAPVSLLADALRGLIKLLDDGDLVRNTDGDADMMKFMRQGTRIMFALQAAQNALESEKSANNRIS